MSLFITQVSEEDMQSLHIRRTFPLFMPLAFPANFHVAPLKAPFGIAVTDKKTFEFYEYHIKLYHLNNWTHEEEEAENCFGWGKRNSLKIHYSSDNERIEGVTLYQKIDHYLFDFRKQKYKTARFVVTCFDSSQSILQQGTSSYIQLLPKRPNDAEIHEDFEMVPVEINWLATENNSSVLPVHNYQSSNSEESSVNNLDVSGESNYEHHSDSNEPSDIFDYQESAVDMSPYDDERILAPQTLNESAEKQYIVLYDGNAEVVGNFRALNFYKASDMNIKEDIRLLADGTKHSREAMTDLIIDSNDVIIDFDCRDVLLRIDGVDYKFKPGIHDNVNRRFVGYIAQQVESVVPSAVQLIDGILHVDYESLIPYLSESIRQNFNDIKNIKADNEKLRHALDSIYNVFLANKSHDKSSSITPFTETKLTKGISLTWRIFMVSIAVIAALVVASAIVLFFTYDQSTPSQSPPSPLPKSNEQIALESFYSALNGPYWRKSGNWLSNLPICYWFGITCQNNSVVGIKLPRNNMTGTIPSNIALLTNLQSLDLTSNSIHGTIPDSITTLGRMQEINLYSNKLEGTLPRDIGSLTSLVSFTVASNALSGTVPRSMSELKSLNSLNLFNNVLDGNPLETVVAMVNLTYLGLGSNRFSGTIPNEITGLSKLIQLDLSTNSFSGTIPETIRSLSALQDINLSNNLITGQLPEDLFKLPVLSSVNLSANLLHGTIHENIGIAIALHSVTLSECYFNGTIPQAIGNLDLSILDFEHNALTGTIPDVFGNCAYLEVLNLGFNRLEGTIPDSLFSNKMKLQQLNLNDNNLFGTIPSSFGSSSVFEINLSNNRLNGTIPIQTQKGLHILDLSNNELDGTWPVLPGTVEILKIQNNRLYGTIDASYLALQQLDVSNNNFTGDLSRIFELTSLQFLNVSHNMFTEVSDIPEIHECDASFNSFKCPLPTSAKNRCKATCVV